MPEFHVAPNGAAVLPPLPSSPAAQLITPERLQQLYDLMLHYQLADTALQQAFRRKKWATNHLPHLQHPATYAGLFSQLQAGDIVGSFKYAFAANLAAKAPLTPALSSVIARAETGKPSRRITSLPPAEQLAAVTGAALAQQIRGSGHLVIALPPSESWQNEKSSAAVLRWAGENRLPILYVTFVRNLPKPGHSQSSFGLPQIAVDANDVVAVCRVAQECVHRARSGIGPTWIQCILPQKSEGNDPLTVMQKFLEARKLFQPSRKAATTKEWREHWKQSWQTACVATQEPLPSLPIASFDAGN